MQQPRVVESWIKWLQEEWKGDEKNLPTWEEFSEVCNGDATLHEARRLMCYHDQGAILRLMVILLAEEKDRLHCRISALMGDAQCRTQPT